MSSIEQRIAYWLSGPFDEDTKTEIRRLQKEDPQALSDAFYTSLSFGTGGMRSLMGIGTARMNIYTIQMATQGLANYLKKQAGPLSAVIGFDSRHHSREFALAAAHVLSGNGIHVHFLPELRPTPYVSFACRHLKATAAIMITASHNPAEYNGYKVYWSDGGQVVHPHDTGIVKEVEALTDLSLVKMDEALVEEVDLISLDNAFLAAIAPLQKFPQEDKQEGHSLKIAYTSLHGTGITLVPRALWEWGFTSIELVDEQVIPDGDFPTVKFPNPEFKETMQLGIETLQKIQGDLLIANDPDADRIGIGILHKGKPLLLTGNEIAAICAEFLSSSTSPNAAIVTTIVTTELLKKIAAAHNITCVEVLTGFKYIGEKIHLWENGEKAFLFGAEESYGYLIGTHARDKDAVSISCLIAEIALHTKSQGKTLLDLLYAIYRQYGIHRDKQRSINFPPTQSGMEQMAAWMEKLRKTPPLSVAGQNVTTIEDYLPGIKGLPASDVLLFRLADESRLVIRPSGTEPKIKIYASVSMRDFPTIDEGIARCDAHLDDILSFFAGT
ncbi:MAG: phospho-sugar mutase [Verrucomicrobia bacterium]|nr:phospho-sugar mutase [Verrucomicrobiota bacterium]